MICTKPILLDMGALERCDLILKMSRKMGRKRSIDRLVDAMMPMYDKDKVDMKKVIESAKKRCMYEIGIKDRKVIDHMFKECGYDE